MVELINLTFNNISVISQRSVLLVEETGVPGENRRPVGKSLEKMNGVRTGSS
jgi:hypothetical protein